MSGSGSGSSLNQSSGCFNGILRRILCTGSVPTHPSDQISDSNTTQLIKSEKDPNFEPKIQSSAGSVTPGIVARLMGLESLPETNWASQRIAPDLVKRSRSVSFADYLMGFDLGDDQDRNQQHRRVRTSVSFREAPVMNHQSSPDFIVVYLDNVDKSKDVGKKEKKSEVGFGGVKQWKKEQRSKKMEKNRECDEVVKKRKEKIVVLKQNKRIDRFKDEPRRECSANSSRSKGLRSASLKKESEHLPVKKATQKKKVMVEPRIKKKTHENLATKEKENRSPVSVFDIDDILFEHEAWLSGYSMPMDLNSKVKSSPKASYNDIPEVIPAKRRDFEPIKEEESRDYAELLAMKIQKWTGEDLKEPNWVPKNAVEFEACEEICVEFEGTILDMLLNQAIDELVEISNDCGLVMIEG